MEISEEVLRKALVALAIERTLIDIGKPVFEEVTSRLFHNYHCYIPDCYEHPQYLKKVLKDIYGNSYLTIVESIKKDLEEFIYKKSIGEFVTVITKCT
ncbi:MAG: hypothetical protein ACREAE_02495 [Nitrosopumilaceae archaeon]